MIGKFVATETGTEEDQQFITTGVASRDPLHYLNFSRSLPFGGDEDWGIEIEYDDQINSGYDKIRECSLNRTRLRVDLIEPIGGVEQYTGFDVSLQLSESGWTALAAHLRTVFTGHDRLLTIDDG